MTIPLPRLLWVLAACAACGGGGSASVSSIKSTPPAGTVYGAPWTMTSATVRNQGGTLQVSLFNDPSVAACGQGSSKPFVLFFVSNAAVGTRQLQLASSGSGQTVTFVDPSQNPPANDVATEGVLDITALTSTSVSMGLNATFDGKNTVNGRFTTTVCPSP